jgi:hypothetical protein
MRNNGHNKDNGHEEDIEEFAMIPSKYRNIDDVQFEKFRKREDWD